MNQLTNSSTSTTDLPQSWIEKLFHRMLLDYGKKFTDQWGGADTDELIAHWAHEMAGYTGIEIKRGLDAMKARDWPATLPEFKKMCRTPVNDLMTYHEAVAGLEARGKGEVGVWSHPAVYWAASLLRVDLMGQTYAQVKDRWAAVLKGQMERTEWADIPAPRVLLPAPDTSPEAKAHAAKMVQELGAVGITKTATDRIDHKRWARNILARLEGGDKSLLLLQIQFAQAAMNVNEDSQA